ncbi:N-formylglutamate amidohydrolase [Candidatus Peregrinibacteria bacterium]|nr:MAG: N-formylglutamate amidohydrolase [Candidatus Peregrinibacteria bacterium]
MEKTIHYNSGSSKLFLEMPHSGRLGIQDKEGVPDLLKTRLNATEAVRASLVFGCDIAVPTMTQFDARRIEAHHTTLSNDLSRIYTDPNRDKNTDCSGRIREGFDRDAFPNGVIWTRTVPRGLNFELSPEEVAEQARAQFEDIFNAPLSSDEFDALMREVYDPYHAHIRETHEAIRGQHGEVIHLSLHTFPPVLGTVVDGGYSLGKPARPGLYDVQAGTFPDLLIIHNDFKAASREKVEVVRRHFKRAGLIVQDGFGPFLGSNGVTGLYGNPEQGVNVIGIEHIPHRIETGRHLGSMSFDEDEAKKHQAMYSALFEELSL